jgi:glycosyltransferase involved in cell wall biosynthesis
MDDLVSIITPTYNSEKYITETIKSIQGQTYTNWELLITDDCSTDQTIDIIKSFQKGDKRIKLFLLNKNQGAGVARNNSIKEANGRYIAFCDSDDLWKEHKLSKQIKFMKENQVFFTYCSYEIVNEKREYIQTIIPPPIITYNDLLSWCWVGCLTAIYDTKILGKKYFPKIRKRQDYILWLKILREINQTKGLLEPLATYTKRQGSISSNKLGLVKYNYLVYKKGLGYNSFKSLILLGRYLCKYIIKKTVLS